ncbi:Transmembrane protein [Orchesella cincta]|uniref:Transmembrane protein n=1 Tax=Orchesella cincta TaxID=48709 RepID=A0A1D2N0X1_ORCCI|nr:Transmembrane protein [Orchesella cincta]
MTFAHSFQKIMFHGMKGKSRTDVYARFLAQDHDSGRTSYFISRKTYLKVTDLISDYLRVSDTQVAVIKGASSPAVQGTGPGRTEVQRVPCGEATCPGYLVVSPVTGRVLGTREVRVVNEKVSLVAMKVQVISGVQLSLFPDTDSDNEFVAETAITSKLSAKYQEALLDISLRFSDGSWVKLDEIERDNYILAVGSLEPTVVELPPIQNSKYPRIIAVSEGSGPIMRVSLELSDQCHRQNSVPLAMSVAQVEVNFTTSTSRSEFTQNDSNLGTSNTKHSFRKTGRGNKERNGSSKKDLSAMSGVFRGGSGNTLHHTHTDIAGILLKDDSSKASMPSQHLGPISVGFLPDKGWSFAAHNTPLEIAMYVLLGVFSVAILVFVASCFVYASRVKKRETPPDDFALGMKMEQNPMLGRFGAPPAGCTTNAHDWVWLGRAS